MPTLSSTMAASPPRAAMAATARTASRETPAGAVVVEVAAADFYTSFIPRTTAPASLALRADSAVPVATAWAPEHRALREETAHQEPFCATTQPQNYGNEMKSEFRMPKSERSPNVKMGSGALTPRFSGVNQPHSQGPTVSTVSVARGSRNSSFELRHSF